MGLSGGSNGGRVAPNGGGSGAHSGSGEGPQPSVIWSNAVAGVSGSVVPMSSSTISPILDVHERMSLTTQFRATVHDDALTA